MSVGTKPSPRVDAHCHIDLYKDFAAVAAEIEAQRVHTIAVTNAPSVFFHTEALARQTAYLYPALGLHPELVGSHGRELPRLLDELPRVKIVGEVGLDYVTHDAELRKRQREVFAAILERCAALRGKVLTVHSRRAAADVVSLVGGNFPCAVILHWFSGTKRELRNAVANGCFFSINPAMVRSRSGQGLIAEMPRERVISETDGPFVDIQGRPTTPSCVAVVVDALADMWRMSSEEVTTQVFATFQQLLAGKDRAV